MGRSGIRVLVVGCGEVGSRHLQAVASLPQVQAIEVVDPRPESLTRGQSRVAELTDRPAATTYRWLTSLDEATPGGDLCIVATQARERCELVRQASGQLGYTNFLIEKVVAQSIPEYEALLEYVRLRRLAVWVNFITRIYPVHQLIKGRLNPDDPMVFTAVGGGKRGLALNGIHAADLFVFYDGTDRIEPAGSRIDPVLHPTKRGPDVLDLTGTLQGSSRKGSHFTLAYTNDDHNQEETISIFTPRYRCIVDHRQRWAMESAEAGGWAWRPIPFEGTLTVSHLTKGFATEILASGRCRLPTLEEAWAAHEFILRELHPHFNQLLQRDVERCPVT